MQNLRIAHIGWLASCHLQRRAGELAQRGVYTLIFTDSIPDDFKCQSDTLIVEMLPDMLKGNPLEQVSWLEDRLEFHEIHVLHIHSTHYPASLGYFCRNIPRINTLWDFLYSKDPLSPLFHKAILHELEKGFFSDAMSFSSKVVMEDWIQRGYPENKAFWHSWGVNFEVFKKKNNSDEIDQLKKQLGIGSCDKVILSPRTTSLLANNDILIQAIPEICRTGPVKLLITGHFITKETRYYERFFENSVIRQNVIFLDTIKDDDQMRLLYEISDIVVSLHSNDHNPATVLESFCMGKPVIINDLPTVGYWVKDGYNGFVTSARHLEKVIGTLKTALSLSSESLLDMGLKGQRSVIREADFHKTISCLIKHYEKIYLSFSSDERTGPLSEFEKGVLFDITGNCNKAMAYYRDAENSGFNHPFLSSLIEEKQEALKETGCLEYYMEKRSQKGVKAFFSSSESEWDMLSLNVDDPVTLDRYDYIAALYDPVSKLDTKTFYKAVNCLAGRFQTDTLEWVAITMEWFGEKWGLSEACGKILLEFPQTEGGTSLACYALKTAEKLGKDHEYYTHLLKKAQTWSSRPINFINKNLDLIYRKDVYLKSKKLLQYSIREDLNSICVE